MKRLQIYIDETMDEALAAEAARSRTSKAAQTLWQADTWPVLTTNHVLGESWTFLRRRLGHPAAVEFLSRAERSIA